MVTVQHEIGPRRLDHWQERVYYGKDVDAALERVRGFSYTQAALRQLGPAETEFAMGRLREMIAEHQKRFGIWFGSRAWVVAARRREQPRKRVPSKPFN
jgi:hypothetical protein